MLGDVRRGVRPLGGLEVGQRHVARAEIVELAERGEAVAHLMTALDPDQRGYLAGLVDADDVVGGIGLLEIARVGRDEALHDVDLFQRVADRAVAVDLGGDVDRPELPADPALPKPRHVGHQGLFPLVGAAGEAFGPAAVIFAQLLGEVVVAVDQRRGLQDAVNAGLDLGVDLLGSSRRGDDQGGGEEERGFGDHGRGLGTALRQSQLPLRGKDEGGNERS